MNNHDRDQLADAICVARLMAEKAHKAGKAGAFVAALKTIERLCKKYEATQ